MRGVFESRSCSYFSVPDSFISLRRRARTYSISLNGGRSHFIHFPQTPGANSVRLAYAPDGAARSRALRAAAQPGPDHGRTPRGLPGVSGPGPWCGARRGECASGSRHEQREFERRGERTAACGVRNPVFRAHDTIFRAHDPAGLRDTGAGDIPPVPPDPGRSHLIPTVPPDPARSRPVPQETLSLVPSRRRAGYRRYGPPVRGTGAVSRAADEV